MLYKDKNDALTFPSQFEAKQFFIDRVVEQAVRENQRITEAERHMLSFGIGAGYHINRKLLERFNTETTEELYEQKIYGLLRGAYRSDVRSQAAMKKAYCNAYEVLQRGDHYILPLIERAIKPRRPRSRKKQQLQAKPHHAAFAVVALVVLIVLIRAFSG